jgi:hypothetical protein
MANSWIDSFAIVLAATVFLVGCLDFLLGKSGRKQLQSGLETFWLRLSYVKLPTLGLDEAQSFLRFLDSVFGPRLVSWRRLFSVALFVVVLIVFAYLTFEASRVASGKPLRWPFIAPHWETGFPGQVVPAMISISITRMIVSGCVRLVGRVQFSTLAFLVACALAGYISTVFTFALGYIFGPIQDMVVSAIGIGVHYITHLDDVTQGREYVFKYAFPFWWSQIKIGFALAYGATRAPFVAAYLLFSLAQENDWLVRTWYDYCIALGFGGIRILFAIAFIGSWIFLPPVKWISSLIMLRLAESERGALTAVATGLALLAKLLQEYLKAS